MKKALLLMAVLALAAPFSLPNANAQNTPNYQFLEDEAEPQYNVAFKVSPAGPGTLSLVFNYKDASNYYSLDFSQGAAGKTVLLRTVLGGVEHKLVSSAAPVNAGSVVTLQRRPWMMRVLIDKKAVLTAYDATLESGRIGFAPGGKWTYSEARFQPVEESVYFNDDFTRQAGQAGEWKPLVGDWQVTALSDRINAGNQDMSANPFSYQSKTSSALSLVQAGRKFWDNYDEQVSVHPGSQGLVGLAVYVQDASNYLAFLWSSTEGPEARRLVKVENGQTTVLAKAGGAFLPRQWYRLGVRTSPGYLEAFIDGTPIFRQADVSFGQGGVGLISQGTSANFDDARVRSFPYFRQDFNGPTGGAWTPDGGFWRADAGILNSAAKPGDGGATRTLVAGAQSWDNYQITASGRSNDTGAAGLMAGYKDDKNFLVYRWAGEKSTVPFKGRAQLLRYKDGKAQILSDDAAPAPDKDGFLRATVRFASGAVSVIVRGEIVAQAADETLKGRPGLWAQSPATVSFRDVIMFLPPEADPPKVAAKFEADSLMVGWASPSGEWPPRRTDTNTWEFWNTGEFFGDASVEYTWRPALNPGAWELALRTKDNFNQGYIVRVEGRDTLKISVQLNGQTLKSADLPLAQIKASDTNPPKLKFEMEGRAILVSANSTPVLSYLPAVDATIPTGTHIAARSNNYILQARDLRALSANRDDYTFSEAPTDWYSPQGLWSVFHRWPCYSDWSFFGGKGQAPQIWTKREYSGDTIVEFYTHPQMNLPKEVGYAHPGDLNVTLFGDGKSLASGYSFVLAGWFNTKTAIMKGNTVVAQTDSLPNAIFDRPINQNTQFHRKWFYVRAEARAEKQGDTDGVRLKFFVDNQLMGEYFDADPPKTFQQGGRVAFWTVDGAMMLARAKIESQSPGWRALPPGLLDAASGDAVTLPSSGDAFVPQNLLMDGLPSAIITHENDGWKMTNPNAGGLFGARLAKAGDAPTKAGVDSVLDMDIAATADVKIDCYLTIDGVRHLVELNGGQRADARVKKLGAATMTAGSGSAGNGAAWKHASFALGEALKDAYPGVSSWNVQKVELGALHGDEYRWTGLQGNSIGASYYVKNVRLGVPAP